MGVDREEKKKQGAGDQGLMFGYATNETEFLMPSPYILLSSIGRKTNKSSKKQICKLVET